MQFFDFHPGFWVPILIWSLVWKGVALWKAARNTHKGWFVALLVVNTAGILDIVYIYLFSKKPSLPSTAKPQDINKL